jgi:hypothetical protein
MRPNLVWVITTGVLTLVTACAPFSVASSDHRSPLLRLSDKARLAAIRRAQVWKAVDVAAANLRVGPDGPGSFAPGATVQCDYHKKAMTGATPKFTCVVPPDDELKVKYGADNGEVYAEVAATRLLWALGFPADRMYPVRIECRGCSSDPFASAGKARDLVVFDPASVERKMKGHEMESRPGSGWAWSELELVDESMGGAPRAHRDALKLLAVLLQHGDNKAPQQRLFCGNRPPEKGSGEETCAEPWMMVQDLGLTFGQANLFNRSAVGSVNFEKWSSARVWADGAPCVGDLAPSQSGSLENPHIGEAGRKFLAGLLVQLSDAQLHDLFDVARFPQRKTASIRAATTEQWVDAFKNKRDQIVNRSCSP